MILSWLSLAVLLGLVYPVGAAYLERETLILDMTGSRQVKTSQPLKQHKEYHLTLKSPYNLLPIWGLLRECNCVKYLLLIDGESPSDKDRLSDWKGHMTEVIWRWWGKGTPLALRLARDITSDIRHATIEVARVKDTPPALEVTATATTPPLWKQPPASSDFLQRESMPLLTNGTAIHSSKSLEPYRNYLIAIRSPYDLARLLGTLQFDGSDARNARLLTRPEGQKEQLDLRFAFRGKGTPVTIRLAKDVSDAVPHAQVDITLDADGSLTAEVPPAPDAAAEAAVSSEASASSSGAAYGVALLVLGGLCVGAVATFRVTRWWYRQMEREQIRIERERRHAEAAEKDAQVKAEAARKDTELKEKAAPWVARAYAERAFLDPRFQRSYARSHTEEILHGLQDTWIADFQTVIQDDELHSWLRMNATPGVDVPAWLDARMAIIDLAKKALEGLLPDDPPPPEPPTPEEAVRHELRVRAHTLQEQVELERNFLDPHYQQDYARKYVGEILNSWGREWFDDYQALRADQVLMELVQEEFPDIVAFHEARLEVFRIAQRLDVAPPPEKPRLTPEDRQRKVSNFRNRVLQWRQTKAEDFIAQRMQQLELLRAFEEDLAQYDLDEDERERLLQDFRQELDLIEPPKPKGKKPDNDEEQGHEGFETIRPDR